LPYFSLIVATLNRTEQHIKLLNSLKIQTDKDFELIIVDQNPHDLLKHQLKTELSNFNTIYLHVKKNMGLSAARNYGLKQASGLIVAFPDDDCWFPAETLSIVHRCFEENIRLHGVTGLVTDEKGSYSAGGFMLKRKSVSINKKNAWMTTNSSAIFLNRRIVNRVGNFDENIGLGAPRYISGEETDLILRICAQESTVRYDPAINIYHDVYKGKYNRDECSRRYGYGLGMGFVLRKHGYNLLHLAFYSAIHFAKGAFMLLRLEPARSWSHFSQGWGRIRGWFEYSQYAPRYAISLYLPEAKRHHRRKSAIGQ
jgi:glycosyltransferase involved in cell wall biosynthesis